MLAARVSELLFPLCHVELRSFLQTLLDLLQRAEDYIRDKVDLTFFTQTLPQLVEHVYSTAFSHTRQRRDLGLSPAVTHVKGTGLTRHSIMLHHYVFGPWCYINLMEYTYTMLLLWAAVVTDVSLHSEHLGGGVMPAQQASSHTPPALFRDVGSSLDDWEKYLANMADDMNGEQTDGFAEISTTRQLEDNLFLQVNY